MGALVVTAALALAELEGPTGPARFGVVDEGAYRGGQPTARHLMLLRSLGVQTIVDLRRGDIFGADRDFLARAVAAMHSGGRAYEHCHVGRDRTSLVVALYRVVVDGWDPEEAVDYGHARWPWYFAIESSYRRALGGRR